MDTKVLSVSLSEADEKAMRKTTRRRRNKKMEGGEDVTQLEKEVAAPMPMAEVVAPTVLAPAPVVEPVAPQAVPGVAGAVGGGIKLAAKKHSTASALPTPKVPKLVMNKKRTSLPISSTIKKPRFVLDAKPVVQTVLEPKKKRRFTERKISITIKPFASTRKERKDIKDKVDVMPIAQVKKILLQKGLLKPNHKTPEGILRSMLHDYMTLHSDI